MKIKAGNITINTDKLKHLFSIMEEKIVVGDVIAFSMKTQYHKMSNNTPEGTLTSVMEVCQPRMQMAVLMKIIDDKRIYVLNENGTTDILNLNYFSDIVLMYNKNSEIAMTYYRMIFDNMCETSSAANILYKIKLLCKISKSFAKEYNNQTEK